MEHLEQLLALRAGLQLREQEREALRKIVQERLNSLKLSLESYCCLLEGGGAQASRNEGEWAHIFARLTNNESYFFRDAGQLALLESTILPQLIERNRATRTLRLWSAGCSTGEEPYSLAMILDEVLPRSQNWNVLILGTDLSEAAVAKAGRGVYGPWSFRATSPGRRERYFQAQPSGSDRSGLSPTSAARREHNDFTVRPGIQQMVTLQVGNLVSDAFPSRASGLFAMDLIVCRNVFIYFDHNAIARVVEKFSRTLSPGSYLLTGHAELHGAPLHGLQARAFPQSIIYQRDQVPSTASAPTFPPAPGPPASVSTWTSTWKHDLPAPPTAASQQAPVLPSPVPASLVPSREVVATNETVLLLCSAQVQADAGHYERARELCRRAMALDALSPAPHQLLARMAWEQGDHEEAKSLFKKVIYLAPSLVWPYIEMDAIYRHEHDLQRARLMRRAALQVLAALPPESPVPEASPVHAALSERAEASLAQGQVEGVVSVRQLIEHLKALD